jgi:hypothetical protein
MTFHRMNYFFDLLVVVVDNLMSYVLFEGKIEN